MFKRSGMLKQLLPLSVLRMRAPKLMLLSLLLPAAVLLSGCETTSGTVTGRNLKAVLRQVCVPPLAYSVSKDTAQTVRGIRVRNQTCENLGV